MRRILICTIALAAVAVPANAKVKPPKAGPYKCVPHKVGFNARGKLVSSELTQTAGAQTPKRGDDRYGGTLTVDVKKANHKGGKGEQTYTLTDVRVRIHPRTVTALKAGDRVKLSGRTTKLGKKCDTSGFTPAVTVRKVDIKSVQPKTV